LRNTKLALIVNLVLSKALVEWVESVYLDLILPLFNDISNKEPLPIYCLLEFYYVFSFIQGLF
jgi:hypothetical protein